MLLVWLVVCLCTESASQSEIERDDALRRVQELEKKLAAEKKESFAKIDTAKKAGMEEAKKKEDEARTRLVEREKLLSSRLHSLAEGLMRKLFSMTSLPLSDIAVYLAKFIFLFR